MYNVVQFKDNKFGVIKESDDIFGTKYYNFKNPGQWHYITEAAFLAGHCKTKDREKAIKVYETITDLGEPIF